MSSHLHTLTGLGAAYLAAVSVGSDAQGLILARVRAALDAAPVLKDSAPPHLLLLEKVARSGDGSRRGLQRQLAAAYTVFFIDRTEPGLRSLLGPTALAQLRLADRPAA